MEAFAAEVLRRFRNPFIHHRLAAIALNSWPKFAARVLPQLLKHAEITGALPQRLVLALAATILLYRGDVIELSDDPQTLAWFKDAWPEVMEGRRAIGDLVNAWLANTSVWGRDLSHIDGLSAAVTKTIISIEYDGIRSVITQLQ